MDLLEYTMGTDLAPLAERMRAKALKDFIGQSHLLNQGSLLQRAIKVDKLGSCIFYGPPGTGKTTLANIIANATNCHYVYLNAVSCGVQDAKKVIDEARHRLQMYQQRTYLFLDECHRWSKTQSDSVLSAIEKGEIIFIGSTTENPYVSMTKAIISRCRIFEFKRLTNDEVRIGVLRAIEDKENGLGNYDLIIEDAAIKHIIEASNGDLRCALNSLELAVISSTPNKLGKIELTEAIAKESLTKKSLGLDESAYYDVLSAFCKSIRGSDPDAALYYALRLINAGIDPLIIARRLIVHSAEDVGLADPMALTIAVSALQALEKIGLPEAKIPLSEAIIYVTLAPKSNAVVNAIAKVEEALENVDDNIPIYLTDKNYKGTAVVGYKYPHDYGGYVSQQYLPDSIKEERFYVPSQNGKEKNIIIPKNND